MAQPQAARLELGLGAVVGARRVAVHGVLQQRLVAQDFEHLHGIVLPVGGAMDVAARRDAAGQQRDERRLDQAALVMALLGPRVGEIDVHAGQRIGGDHVAHHFHRVVLDDAQVLDAGILDPAQQRTHARVEHLHAQEVVARTRQRDLLGGLAHAEADLQHRRRLAAERGGRVQPARGVGQGPLAQQLLQRGQLALRDVAAAMHEAADVGGAGAVGRVRGAGQRGFGLRGNRGGRVGIAGYCGGVHGKIRKAVCCHRRDCSGRAGARGPLRNVKWGHDHSAPCAPRAIVQPRRWCAASPAMNIARIDLVTLSLFVSVARQGSISAGARQSHLAVGAASKRISDLEAALDTQLLYRNAAGVELTEAGQACLVHALRVLQEVEQMAGTLSDFAQGVRGQVRIAANTSSLTQFLPEDLAAFMEAHPAVRIDLEEQNSNDIVTAVQENRADIGIFADRTPAPGLVTTSYRRDELVLIVPQRHPLAGEARVAFADTLAYDYVGLPPATSLATRLAEESGRLGRTMQLRIQVRSFDAICRMVAATGGVGILPRLAAEPHARSMPIRLIALTDDWASRRLLLGVRDADALPVPARLLLAHLRGQQ